MRVCPLSEWQSLSSVVSEFTLFCFVFRLTYLQILYFIWTLCHIYVLSASAILLKRSSLISLISSHNWCSFIWAVLGLIATVSLPLVARIILSFNPLNPELNPICYLLALLGAHHFLHVSRIRVKILTFRRLMSYTYGAPILDVSRSHTTTQHSR